MSLAAFDSLPARSADGGFGAANDAELPTPAWAPLPTGAIPQFLDRAGSPGADKARARAEEAVLAAPAPVERMPLPSIGPEPAYLQTPFGTGAPEPAFAPRPPPGPAVTPSATAHPAPATPDPEGPPTAVKGQAEQTRQTEDSASDDGPGAGALAAQPPLPGAADGEASMGANQPVALSAAPSAPRPQRLPVPRTARSEPALLRSTPLYLRVESLTFDAPRTLPFVSVAGRAVPAQAGRGDPGYLAVFAEASSVGYDSFLALRDGASRIAESIGTADRERSARHANALALSVQRLDFQLATGRFDLTTGRDKTLLRLARNADEMRWRIHASANQQLGRLHKRKAEFDTKLEGAQKIREGTETFAKEQSAALTKGLGDAKAAISGLSKQKDAAHVTTENPWTATTNEAIDQLLSEAIKESLSKTGLAQFDETADRMAKMARCLPCQFDGQFLEVEQAAARVGKAGPNAVCEARDGALATLDAAEEAMRQSIVEVVAATDTTMVEQHDGARQRMFESTAAIQSGEQQRAATLGRSQIRVLESMANAQSTAVNRVVDGLAGLRKAPDGQLQTTTVKASRRLKASLLQTAARQPAAMLLATGNHLAGLSAGAARFDRELLATAEGTERTIHGLSGQTLDQLETEIAKMIASMADVPASLIAVCTKFFEPDKPPYLDMLSDLITSTTNTAANVRGAFAGQATKDAELKIKRPAPAPGDAAKAAPAAKPKQDCGDCNDTSKTEEKPDKTKDADADSKTKKDAAAPPKTVPPGGDDLSNPDGIAAYAAKVAKKPTDEHRFAQFQATAKSNVQTRMDDKLKTVISGLDGISANRDMVLGAIRGITPIQAGDIKSAYKPPPLTDAIRKKFRRGWSAPATKRNDRDAALSALNGDPKAAAISELRAAFNLQDDNKKAFAALLAISPDALAGMDDEQKKELIAMAGEMDGLDREKFQALIDGKVAKYNALAMRETMKDKRNVTGAKGWTETGKALEGFEKDAGTLALSGNRDTFGIDPSASAGDHNKKLWQDTILEHGKLELGEAATTGADGKALSADEQLKKAQDSLISLATQDRTHVHRAAHEPKEPVANYTTTVVDSVDAGHKLWIERIVRKGSDHPDTLAARVQIGETMTDAKLAQEHLSKGLHFASADAVKDGAYNQDVRNRGLKYAEAKRHDVLVAVGIDKEKARHPEREPDPSTIDVAKVAAGLKINIEANFANDEMAREMLVGTVGEVKGNPLATIKYAIKHESKELILEQFKRMDRSEIEQLVKDYGRPDGKSLDEVLGINGEHWSWHNWNGAVFSGDDANEVEQARMGVPQNPVERGEVALRIMDQQIDQSGWMGRALAGSQYDALQANAKKLRALMGVSRLDIDERGYLRREDPITKQKVRVGNFDEKGNFVPPEGASTSDFEKAVFMAEVTAENYTAAVDRIASLITTGIAVIAGAILSVATLGVGTAVAIALIAGALTIVVNASMRGGRYSRDDLTRDLVAVAVQALTAGIGAGIGNAARGAARGAAAAAKAGKTAAEFAKGLGVSQRVLLAASRHPILTGAALGALSSGISTALDPAMRRREDYGDQVGNAIFRGGLGGAVTAGVTHGLTSGASRLAQRGAVDRAMANALSRGASPEAAIRFASRAAAGVVRTRAVEIGLRTVVGGTAGMLGRGAEMGYENYARTAHYSSFDFYNEMRNAFIHSAMQNALEGVGTRYKRTSTAIGMAEDRDAYRDQAEANRRMAGEAFDREMGRMGLGPRGSAEPPVARAASPQQTGAEESATQPVIRAIGEDPARPRVPTPSNDNEAGTGVHLQVRAALAHDAQLAMVRIAEGSVFVHPDATNLHAANDNFGTLINADPAREAAIYHNPGTGEYLVIQGASTSVALIRSDGEIHGPGIKGYPAGALASPGGHWELRSHFHPNETGMRATSLSRRLPSGKYADFTVLEHEARFLAARSADGRGERTSRIYFLDNGAIRYTDFSVTVSNGAIRYALSFPGATRGLTITDSFTSLADYHHFVSVVIGKPYPVSAHAIGARTGAIESGLDPTRRIGGERASIDDQLTPQNRAALESASGRANLAREFETARNTRTPHASGIDPVFGRAAAINDVHAMVADMGLVDRPDAMRRLAAVLNDQMLSQAIKADVLEAVHHATRASLIQRGELAPGEPLFLTLHGAAAADAASIRKEGINLRFAGTGARDDFGAASYFTRQIANASEYGKQRGGGGMMFPAVLRGRDLGTVIDVSPGGAHRSEWEAFVRQNMHLYVGEKHWVPPGQHARFEQMGEGAFAADPANAGRKPGFLEAMKLGEQHHNQTAPFEQLSRGGNRGEVFDAFLSHLAAQRGDPALAHPDMVMGELGGAFTSGIGHGDQQAIRSQQLADLVNKQLAIGRFAASDDEAAPAALAIRAIGESDKTAARPGPRLSDVSPEIERMVERSFVEFGPEPPAGPFRGVSKEERAAAGRRQSQLPPEGHALVSATLAAFANRGDEAGGQFAVLMSLAPATARRVFRQLAEAAWQGRSRMIGNADVEAVFREAQANSHPPALASIAARNLFELGTVGSPLHQQLLEAPYGIGFQAKLSAPLADALEARTAVRVARQFGDRDSPNAERRTMRRLLDADTDGVVAMMTGDGTLRSRAMRFVMRRIAAGASIAHAYRDGFALFRLMRNPDLEATGKTWSDRLKAVNIDESHLAALVRSRPDALLHLARTSPRQLSEYFADYVLRQLPGGKTPSLDPAGFADYVRNRMVSNALPVVSEASSVWSNLKRLGIQLLKADSISRGGANRPGLDVVGFSVEPGRNPRAGDDVRVVIIDDKALVGSLLERVSAMTGRRLPVNLRTTAGEVETALVALIRTGAVHDNPELTGYVAGARAAVRQMRNAARELDAIGPPPANMRENRRYLSQVQRVLARNGIEPVISSEYGNIRDLAPWLRRQGFRMDFESSARYEEVRRRIQQQLRRRSALR